MNENLENPKKREKGSWMLTSLVEHPLIWLGGLIVAAFLSGISAILFIQQQVNTKLDPIVDQISKAAEQRIDLYLKQKLENEIETQPGNSRLLASVPTGAVVAFGIDKCPAGWETYDLAKGRVIVGVGHGNRDQNGQPLTDRRLKEDGGEERHRLIKSEMPAHDHEVYMHAGYQDRSSTRTEGAAAGDVRTYVHGKISGPSGGGQPHNTMPPFLALHYCIKLAGG